MRSGFFSSLVFALITTLSVGAIAAPSPDPLPVPAVASEKLESSKIDLNNADAETLQRELVGVGKAKAQAIVAYRDSNGPFSSVDELLEVKGIGKAILEKNQEKLEAR